MFQRHDRSFSHLIFHINEWTHVKFLRESHAVVKLDAVHSGVVKIKPLQLECQQVREVQKSQTLCREAFKQQSHRSWWIFLHGSQLPHRIFSLLTFRASHFFLQRSQKYWLGPSRVSGWINACKASS